ncbi:hypothetical protein ACEWPL_014695 [Roseovarius sp. S1116L3]|uniref:hypothetical protein n=1 Tax=Roseovarius roseus TaxID=3342636 RepID=UPI00372C6171
MTGPQRTLLIILAFVALVVGSFVWFISTWDADHEEPVTLRTAAPILLARNIPGSGAAPRSAAAKGAGT